jgi:V8-like Glu-specific endopeptidase
MMPGVQFNDILEGILSGYDADDLRMMLRVRLDTDINAIVAAGRLRTRVSTCSTRPLANPRNDRLLAIYRKYGLAPGVSAQQGGVEVQGVQAVGDGLQQTIRLKLPTFDFAVWREKMALVEGRVCRVELNGNAAGTGFLVGPDAVLTNYHVLESVLTGATPPETVRCRFDYKILSDGSRLEGTVVGLHPTDWKTDASPPSAAERTLRPEEPPPTGEELDYALVKLARSVANEPVTAKGGTEAPRRGWVTVPTFPTALLAHMPLMIAQYPDGKPLKLAVDTDAVIGTVADGNRVRYATNTDHGSSGSPVFDMDWKLVALHHLGDPAVSSMPARYNQGVPIARIRARLTLGKAAALGAAE